jgi:hypothetical protein
MESDMMNAAYPTAPARSYSMMSQSRSAGCLCITGETGVDWPTLSTWARSDEEMRGQASGLIEKLPSLARRVVALARRPHLRQCVVAKLVWFALLGFMLAITAGMVQ